MSELNFIIDKEKTLAVTGHRNLKNDISKKKLKEVFIEQIKLGVDTFLIGMAVGFDMLCFQALEELRKKHKITLIACVPCRGQHKNFSEKDKKEYIRQVNSADYYKLICEEYTSYCMLKRNRFMVDNANTLVCYLRENSGGTFYTVNYAKEKGVKIIEV